MMQVRRRIRQLARLYRRLVDWRAAEAIAFDSASTGHALGRLAARGHGVETVIDVGASNGMWSDAARRNFPDAHYLLIEAQACHRKALEIHCLRNPRARYVLAAAGPRRADFIYFNDDDPFAGLAQLTETAGCHARLPVTTIDDEIREAALPPPYLLKLDTHGFEVPILDGAKETLRQASIVVIEVYNFRVTETSLLFWEMCRHMEDRGFSVGDFSEPMWRTRDAALWQMDLFFVPSSSPERQHNSLL